MPDFLVLAIAAALGVALVAGPLGAFVVWRRMAYFGDTLAHSALLGVAAALWLQISPGFSVAAVCLILALVLIFLQHKSSLAIDTLLGILSHSSLALGLVAIYLIPGARTNLETLLFGDLLTVTAGEVAAIWFTGISVLLMVTLLWRQLLSITVHEDLARVDGIAVNRVRNLLMLSLALVIAIAMKVVGVLLITALLVIPAATARRYARSPEAMAVFASLLGCLAVIVGIAASWFWDTPAGPSIVLAASLVFVFSLATKD